MLWHPPDWAFPHADAFSVEQHFFDVLLFVVEVAGPFADRLVERLRDVLRVHEAFPLVPELCFDRGTCLPLRDDVIIG